MTRLLRLPSLSAGGLTGSPRPRGQKEAESKGGYVQGSMFQSEILRHFAEKRSFLRMTRRLRWSLNPSSSLPQILTDYRPSILSRKAKGAVILNRERFSASGEESCSEVRDCPRRRCLGSLSARFFATDKR